MSWNRNGVNVTVDENTENPFEPKLDKMFSHPDKLDNMDDLVFALTAVYDQRVTSGFETPIELPLPTFLSLDTCSRATTFNGMDLSN